MAAAALTAAAAVITAQASSPKFFQAATQADFLKGDVDNLSIDGRGQLLLGPATASPGRCGCGRWCPISPPT